jgi:chaperonin GroEL
MPSTIKKIIFGQEAREKIRDGVDIVASAVRVTLGPRGRTVLLENEFGQTQVVNSGVIVAKSIVLEDEFENMGAQLLKEVSSKTSEAAGDGTTTATVLAHSMVHEGLKYLSGDMNPMDLRRGIDRSIQILVDELTKLAKPCTSSLEIKHVATISANNDQSIGGLIADAIDKVGLDGAISIEDGSGLSSLLEIVEGMQFDRGYLSSYFINNLEKQASILENCSILLIEEKINSIDSLLPLLDEASKSSRQLLIIAEDFSTEALATLVINNIQGTLRCCAVKAPEFGEHRKEIMKDISILIGGIIINQELGIDIKKVKFSQLGKAKRIEVYKDRTAIIGGSGSPSEIKNRVATLKQEFDSEKNSYTRNQLHRRIGKISGGVAIIKIGAATEAELKERKLRIEDALHATRAAVEEGIVPGGGVTLLRIGKILASFKGENLDEDSGKQIVLKSLEAPLRCIVENAGIEPSIVLQNITESDEQNYGYNAATRKYGNLLEMGVVDPAKVTRLALQNAGSIASLILATDCIIATKHEKLPPQGMPTFGNSSALF